MRTTWVAIDWDGTICEHPHDGNLDHVGPDVPGAKEGILQILRVPTNKLIIWTMRSGKYLRPVRHHLESFLTKEQLKRVYLNQNPEQDWSTSPKQYAHIYIDDAALGCPLRGGSTEDSRDVVDWEQVTQQLIERHLIYCTPSFATTPPTGNLATRMVMDEVSHIDTLQAFWDAFDNSRICRETDIQVRIVDMLLDNLPQSTQDKVLELINLYGSILWADHAELDPDLKGLEAIVIGLLRRVEPDSRTPSGCWSYYWIKALEMALA
jgi:hypothetical protein